MNEFLIKELEIVAYFSQYSNEGVKVSLYEEQPEKRIQGEPEKRIIEQAKPINEFNPKGQFDIFYNTRMNDKKEPENLFIKYEIERLKKLINPFDEEQKNKTFENNYLPKNNPIIFKWRDYLELKKESLADRKGPELINKLKGVNLNYSNEQIENLFDNSIKEYIDTTLDNLKNILNGNVCKPIIWKFYGQKGNGNKPNKTMLKAFIQGVFDTKEFKPIANQYFTDKKGNKIEFKSKITTSGTFETYLEEFRTFLDKKTTPRE